MRSLPGAQVAKTDGADLDPDQPLHRVPHGGQQSTYDVLATLVQDQLDQGSAGGRGHHPETVDPHDAVLELDSIAQPLAPGLAGWCP